MRKLRSHLTIGMMLIASQVTIAQVSGSAGKPTVQPPQVPLTLQIRKTIVFLRTDCLHDFHGDPGALTKQQLLQMPLPQEIAVAQQLMVLTSRLLAVKQSMAKLNPEDMAALKQNVQLGENADEIAEKAAWRASVLAKMTSLSAEDIAAMTPQELSLLPADQHLGTGFFVLVTDSRLVLPEGTDKTQQIGFMYLVTNRHMVQPGVEVGKPCEVIDSVMLLNRKADATHRFPYAEAIGIGGGLRWFFSEDDSVDLAVSPITLSANIFDFTTIPTTAFVTSDQIKNNLVVEGDPVLFAGLFIQSFNELHTLEPILRSGILAMRPDGLLETTINKKPGHVYLAEAHAFGGNSGSPILIDTNKFANIISAPSYKLLGVISGEVLENSDLSLNVTTSFTANIGANSGVSMVVPADELLKILNSSQLQGERDAAIAKQPHLGGSQPVNQQSK